MFRKLLTFLLRLFRLAGFALLVICVLSIPIFKTHDISALLFSVTLVLTLTLTTAVVPHIVTGTKLYPPFSLVICLVLLLAT